MRSPAPGRELAALGHDGRSAAMLEKHRRRTDVAAQTRQIARRTREIVASPI